MSALGRGRCGGMAGFPAVVALAVAALAAGTEASTFSGASDETNLTAALALDWAAGDPVEVYYSEFLLAQWVLEKAPWNAYHSAVAFVNNRTDEKALFDFTPEDTSSVMNMVMPDVSASSSVRASLLGDYELVWRNAAKMQFHNSWPEKYTNFVRLGSLNGTVFKRFAEWVVTSYAPKFSEFQPLEVAVEGKGNVVRSRMCHDFVTDAMWTLHKDGVELKPKESIFRDHIIMYASGVTSLGGGQKRPQPPKERRQWLRFLRSVGMYMEAIKDQFTHGRAALLTGHKLGIPVFWHTEHEDYEVHLVPPFLNYCYITLAIPPQVHDPFTKMKLCALGLEANMRNETSVWPDGPLLAVEQRFDRPELPLSIALVALVAAVSARK